MSYRKKGLALVLVLLSIFAIISINVHAGFEKESFISEIVSRMTDKEKVIVFNYNTDYDNIDINQVKQYVREAIDRADDYTRYTVQDWKIRLQGSSGDVEIRLNFNYYNDSSDDDYVFQRVEAINDSILNRSMNVHQKIKTITDYIAVNVKYDDYQQRYSAYNAIQGRSTCQGYALLTYLMLKQSGIENQIIVGKIDNENHAWNLVNVSGNYYHLDLTQISSYYHKYNELLYNEYLVNDSALQIRYSWNQNDYPGSSRSYYQQLKNELQYSNSKLYQELIKSLNLDYMAEENTARTRKQLKDIIVELLAGEGNELRLRVSVGLLDKDLINSLINDIFAENPDWTNIYRAWNFRLQENYIRDGMEDSGLLIVSFVKR
ncbi:MAG: transglutaminase domain-containing protein [Halanaerobiales bacterium]